MTNEERTRWLSVLKVGDEVAYRFSSQWVIAKVNRITPTRRFNLSNGTDINADGSIRGNKYFYIQPVTEEIKVSAWRNKAIRKLEVNLKIKNLTNENLKILLEMLDTQRGN